MRRPRLLVDRQNPFRQSERLQQLEVARAAHPCRRTRGARRPEEPARRCLCRFPHRCLRVGDDAQQGQEIPGHSVGMTPRRRQTRFELDHNKVGEDRNLPLAWATNLRWDEQPACSVVLVGMPDEQRPFELGQRGTQRGR